MKSLIEKYKILRELKEAKAYEEWKKTKGKSVTKNILLSSFCILMSIILSNALFQYFFNDVFSWREFRINFFFALFFCVVFGLISQWNINKNYKNKLSKEKNNYFK